MSLNKLMIIRSTVILFLSICTITGRKVSLGYTCMAITLQVKHENTHLTPLNKLHG